MVHFIPPPRRSVGPGNSKPGSCMPRRCTMPETFLSSTVHLRDDTATSASSQSPSCCRGSSGNPSRVGGGGAKRWLLKLSDRTHRKRLVMLMCGSLGPVVLSLTTPGAPCEESLALLPSRPALASLAGGHGAPWGLGGHAVGGHGTLAGTLQGGLGQQRLGRKAARMGTGNGNV